MLSRVADSAYWMSRYLERAENSARLADVSLRLTLDGSSETVRRLRAMACLSSAGEGGEAKLRESIAACIAAARENARQIREQISTEMWEQLNGLYLLVSQRDRAAAAAGADFFRFVKQSSHLFQGITDATMTQNQCWHFIQIGRYIERATSTAGMLEDHYGDAAASPQGGLDTYIEWAGLLRSCSAFEAYCRCYTADMRPEHVAEFLLLNAQFPRSVHFAVDRVEASLRDIARAVGKTPARVDRLAGRLQAMLDFSQIDEIMAADLRTYVREVKDQCERVHVALYQAYIGYALESAIL